MAAQPGRPRKVTAGPRRQGRQGNAGRAAGTADRFAALADPTRRHLLEELAGRDLTVSELTDWLDELERWRPDRAAAAPLTQQAAPARESASTREGAPRDGG